MSSLEALQNTERLARAVSRRQLVHIGGVGLIATTALVTGGCASTMGALGAPVFPEVDMSRTSLALASETALRYDAKARVFTQNERVADVSISYEKVTR